ncbi:hypothetical protein BGZ80_002953, partial [Entomortierella chlamydospora]
RRAGYSTGAVRQSTEPHAAYIERTNRAPNPTSDHTLHTPSSYTSSSTSTATTTPSIASTFESVTTPVPVISPTSTSIPTPSNTCNINRKKVIFHKWDEQTDAMILSLHREYDIDWRTIGALIGKSHTTCYCRYTRILEPKLAKGWVPPAVQDQARLTQMVDQSWAIKGSKAAEIRAKAEAAATPPPPKIGGRVTWDAATDQKILAMLQGGKNWQEIGHAIDRPYSSCYTRYYSALDPALKEPWSREVFGQINEKVAQGVSWKQIAKDLNIRPITLKAKWTAMSRSNESVTAGETRNEESKPKPSKDKSSVKWIAFSKDESTKILDLVDKYGMENWGQVHKDFQEHFIREATTSPASNSAISRMQKRATRRILSITVDNLRHQHSRLARSIRSWTFDQETVLIQQVLKLGTEGHWDEIARLSGFHTPAECRSHWKQLDMPINDPSPGRWKISEQTMFWRLWGVLGSDFERISKWSGGSRSPEDCQRYFDNATIDFPDRETDPDGFKKHVEQLSERLPASQQRYAFTKQRSIRLQAIIKQYSRHANRWAVTGTWGWVANQVQRGLPARACMEHWSYLCKNMDPIHGPLEQGKTVISPKALNFWSHEELKLLDQGIRELGSNWRDIRQQYLPWREARSIRQRWMLMSEKSTKVTEEEYYTIVAAGATSEEIDYDSLAKKMPGWKRLPCRRVFETSYKHVIANTVWTPEEDRLLIEKTLEIKRHDWNTIAKYFDGVQTARAPLYDSTANATTECHDGTPPMRTRKTGWQCRLRWCQLVEPLMPQERILSVSGQSLAIKLSKKLLGKEPKLTTT